MSETDRKLKTLDSKKGVPWVSIHHPDFKWTSGADVQATWRKYGWVPPSAGREPVYVEVCEPKRLGKWR